MSVRLPQRHRNTENLWGKRSNSKLVSPRLVQPLKKKERRIDIRCGVRCLCDSVSRWRQFRLKLLYL